MPVKFGTDGWRDIIAEDFTHANLRRVARAHARALRSRGGQRAVVGFDTRFGGERFANVVAQALAEQGLEVLLAGEFLPTPALSFAVTHYGADTGVMITASHNPPAYSGYKVKGPYGGTATPELIAQIEAELQADLHGERGEGDVASAGLTGTVRPFDVREAYYRQLDSLLNLEALRAFRGRLIHDPMGGAGCGWLKGYVQHAGLGLEFQELHGRPDPMFHGLNPEPIPQNLGTVMQVMRGEGPQSLAVITDGDADRVGAVTPGGQFFNSHKIFAVLLRHLYGRGLRGRVVKTVSGSHIIERLARQLELPLVETPVGFKYITDEFLRGQQDPAQAVLLGGEESGGFASLGHIPERDGLLNGLLLLESIAVSGQGLDEQFAVIERETGFRHEYDRRDLHLPASFDKAALMARVQAYTEVAGQRVEGKNTVDGVKLYLQDGASAMFRASGTEPVVRIYVEASDPERVQAILAEAVVRVEQGG